MDVCLIPEIFIRAWNGSFDGEDETTEIDLSPLVDVDPTEVIKTLDIAVTIPVI